MHQYFKKQQKNKWKEECPDFEDVFDEETGIAQSMTEYVLA